VSGADQTGGPTPEAFAQVSAATQDVYDRKAHEWHQGRPSTEFEQKWIERFTARIPKGGHVLDLGCGSGKPVADYLLGLGYQLTGLDYAPGMIKLAKDTYPNANWRVGDMAQDLPAGPFDGIISWDGFFHLKRQDQTELLRKIARHIKPGGALMLTVGGKDGEVLGSVYGEQVYHASLDPEAYKSLLSENGFRDVLYEANHTDAHGRTILFGYRA
jgi:SAM-dependent methyltransferase